MKQCSSSSVCRVVRSWSLVQVRATCFALAFVTGLLCLWNFQCTLLAALFFTTVFAAFVFSRNSEVIPFDKNTEVVLVTGCDTGLGYSLARHLHSIGLRVIAGVHADESYGALELSAIEGILVYPLDVTSCESVINFGSAVRNYLETHGLVLRAFVNNAGTMIFGEFEWQTEDQTRQQIEVNLLGTMRVTREFMSIFRTHLTRVIVVTSHCASEPLPGVATYGATKAALSAWATALRVELKKYNVDVVSFIPGSFVAESNLLSRQKRHFETMESAMTEEAKSFYGDYFTRYANYLSNLAPEGPPRMLVNPSVYRVFESTICDRHPRAVYKCEPWRYWLYHFLFKITPTSLRDRLVERFVQLPVWRENKRKGHTTRTANARCC